MYQTFGNGLLTTVEIIYFTFFVGLAPSKVALGLSIAGGMSLLCSVPAGHIADRQYPDRGDFIDWAHVATSDDRTFWHW